MQRKQAPDQEILGFAAVYDDDPQCADDVRGPKLNANGEYEVEITDWKNPPKNIPWSTIVTIKSPFETYKAVWDQDYKGKGCFISCDYYFGFQSKWTGESVSVAFFTDGPYTGKHYQEIQHGVEVQVNGQRFSVYGHGDDMMLPAKLQSTAGISYAKISLRIHGNNGRIYNMATRLQKQFTQW